EFRSEPVDEELHATSATATLFLVTGKEGMTECATVMVEIARAAIRPTSGPSSARVPCSRRSCRAASGWCAGRASRGTPIPI
ncbi:MAG TPA: hypothetical protein VJ829_03935, partial [Candidatus Binatia bacterium]|nr:hypothetical protein [Candidatus Binatia bacterium]